MKKGFYLTVILLILFYSCNMDIEDAQEDQVDPSTNDITNLSIPSDFDFTTVTEMNIEIEVMSITDEPLSGIKVSFFTEHPDFGGEFLSSAFTNAMGIMQSKIQVPAYLEEVFVQVHSIGFANQQTVDVSPYVNLSFGGQPEPREDRSNNSNSDPIYISNNYYYMGTYNAGTNKGLPHYLESEGDDLNQAFLDDVNASLPEGRPVPDYNPEYLTTGNELDVIIEDQSDVWVTFVTEGAGYRNALGYYVYDTDNPPANTSEIDSIHVVLPNASLAYSGGELYAGDKIRLGRFDAGQTISWVLFQNAWNGSGVNVNATKYYSKPEFNTNESNPAMRQHTVQLMDIGRELLLNAFEDLPRSNGSSDEDFNDLVFYVTANPWEAVAIENIPAVTPETDTDDDGISDDIDEFPEDPTVAVRNTFTGSLAYEDLWPNKGDYDFNDLVLDYNIAHVLNGDNQLVRIEADWTVKAVGAGFQNGFGIELDGLTSGDIASVTGQDLQDNIIFNIGNGTESNQTNASIIIFDNVYNVIQSEGGAFINTIPENPYTSPVTISTVIELTNPISQNVSGLPPYDPFIFINGDRTKEVHLPGESPTDLADLTWFGTSADATDPSIGYYYKTENGLPWAINIATPFDYPIESSAINHAYLNFASWATSGGTLNPDWYLDRPANRDWTKIFD
ncbi:MAG: LruC domain-containing protein [Winogradskyella sp.]|uniref:LruC domain-containing protein n=1 Tax=Winogradskyella sp. TaxID=1883156 RepID=UPI0025F5269C|nr:LruC domain-containing protein [Winogradskyella sp.]NRB59899.1 LruC domain-containing protein [Winogradskyella sp.]